MADEAAIKVIVDLLNQNSNSILSLDFVNSLNGIIVVNFNENEVNLIRSIILFIMNQDWHLSNEPYDLTSDGVEKYYNLLINNISSFFHRNDYLDKNNNQYINKVDTEEVRLFNEVLSNEYKLKSFFSKYLKQMNEEYIRRRRTSQLKYLKYKNKYLKIKNKNKI